MNFAIFKVIIPCLLMLPLCVRVLCCVLVLFCSVILGVQHLAMEERADCFTIIVLWLSVFLPRDVVGWSAVCDYGINWSYSLTLSR